MNKARTIFIAGAGVTGVEAAGELAFEYKREKEIILVGLKRLEIRSTECYGSFSVGVS